MKPPVTIGKSRKYSEELHLKLGLNDPNNSCKPQMAERNIKLKTKVSSTPVEVKNKWRQQQVATQQVTALSINATWRKDQIQSVWSGWLHKKGRGISGQWQQRWFELRRELDSAHGDDTTILQYQGNNGVFKRLVIVGARQEGRCKETGWARISVAVAGRRWRVHLALSSAHEADMLLTRISSMIVPATSRAGWGRRFACLGGT